MPSSSPPFRSLLSIVPPELEAIDAAWNDEAPTRPGDVSERVTKVPSMPSELLAKQLMREARSDRPQYEGNPSPRDLSELEPDFEGFDSERDTEVSNSPSQAVTYRPPIASALTPSEAFYGSPSAQRAPTPPIPAPDIFESDGSGLTLANNLENQPFSAHEAPTRAGTVLENDLEFDLSEAPSTALERAEEAARLNVRSGLEIARRLSSIPAGPADPLADMRDRFAMGDFSGALEVADRILASDPDQQEAFRCAQSCRDVLTDMYTSRIGGTQQRPLVTMSPDQIRWLSLDHRAGFLLSMIDGISTIDELLDICGMPRLEALRILCSLLDQQAVVLEA